MNFSYELNFDPRFPWITGWLLWPIPWWPVRKMLTSPGVTKVTKQEYEEKWKRETPWLPTDALVCNNTSFGGRGITCLLSGADLLVRMPVVATFRIDLTDVAVVTHPVKKVWGFVQPPRPDIFRIEAGDRFFQFGFDESTNARVREAVERLRESRAAV